MGYRAWIWSKLGYGCWVRVSRHSDSCSMYQHALTTSGCTYTATHLAQAHAVAMQGRQPGKTHRFDAKTHRFDGKTHRRSDEEVTVRWGVRVMRK